MLTDVLISELGPRDGLQSVDQVMSTGDKQRWIDALVAAGIQKIEAGISTAFGCTIQGMVSEDDVVWLAKATLAALKARQRDGHGQSVTSALFENNVFLVAQHMMQFAVTGKPAAPMPSRVSAWGIYDVFTVKDNDQIFLSVVSDTQWQIFCDEFDLKALFADERLKTNNLRVDARDWLMPQLRERFAHVSAKELSTRFESRGLPYAPITRPQDLFEDPHLKATDGLALIHIHGDCSGADREIDTVVPMLPLVMNQQRLGIGQHPPSLGSDTQAILQSLGYSLSIIESLRNRQVIR